LAFALVANMQLFSGVLIDQHLCVTGTYNAGGTDPYNACTGGIDLVNYFGRAVGAPGTPAQVVDGFMYLISPIYRPLGNNYGGYFDYILKNQTPVLHIPEWLHVISYIIFLMILCVIFGQFWVETTNMDAKSVAEQLDSAGMNIPGYRRDPRVVAAMLEKYIPPIVIMGSAFVGLLAGLADLTGALGTGTGILLTVSIIYKMYQDMERQNAFSSSAIAAQLFGK
jgi:preprotein translocase subunit SecY